ncbi:hypothetical protein CBR_g50856 [Chara braunii]|uniref:RNA-directed DNA polymerase n=1 Tax=Chara braunii TaxID=69332 RepID=A0A388M7S6_CHABU|nr:hypothetical protein CBR_g50856 [Chara braunii]|eukprot:GBG90512.1 hypothetical protein CBR_g50856 [Chara braunii]
MPEEMADGGRKLLTVDDLINGLEKRERAPSNVPKVETFHFKGDRVSDWLDVTEQALVGLSDEVKLQRVLRYVLHSHHREVTKVVDATGGSWAKFGDLMRRKYSLGDGLLTMNKEDFSTIGAFVHEFKKRARKVHGISEEAQCATFLGLLIGSEATELTKYGEGSERLTWATIEKGVEEGSLDQVEQHQMRLQRRKRKERDVTASGTPGVKRIVTDVLAALGYDSEAELQKRVVAVAQGRASGVVDEEEGREDYGGGETGSQALTKAQRKQRNLLLGGQGSGKGQAPQAPATPPPVAAAAPAPAPAGSWHMGPPPSYGHWVRDQPSIAMVDTGAEMNIIRERDATMLGLEVDHSDHGVLHGANCKAIFCGTPSNVMVEIGRVRARMCFFVMPDVDHPILLGRSFLCRTETLVFNRHEGTMILALSDPACGNYEIIKCRNTGPESARNRLNLGSFTFEESEYARRRLREEQEGEGAGEVLSLSLNDVNKAMEVVAAHDMADPEAIKALREQERTLMVETMRRRHCAYAFNDDERGRLDVDKIPMIRIHTVSHEPWNLRGARYPNPDEEKKVVDYLDGKMRTYVADYSSGPYVSPWFCFIKPKGTLRWVQDLQRLNAVTVRDAGGLPNADALSESCAGRPIISLINLYSGYDQFPVYPPDRPVTAMHTPRGLIHMNVAPQGWTNAVAMVQRHMIRAMQTVSPHITQPYIDDLAVKGPKEKEEDEVIPGVRRFVWKHVQDIDQVLGLLEEHNLTAGGPKSKHCMREATILGFVCNEKGRRPDVKKTDKILEAFKKASASDQEWVCSEDQEKAVERMKGEFREGGLVLGAPNYEVTEEKPFVVETDAGPTALGGVLIQADANGKERPLRFERRTLNTTERNYSQFKKETLAVLHCLRTFRNYIFGRRLILRVDPTALACSLKSYTPSDPTIARWLTYIWMFNFELERILGDKNTADGLSRINWDGANQESIEDTPPVDGFLDQEEDARLHINEWSLRVPSCVAHPIWLAPRGYEEKEELVLKPFQEEDPWGSKDVGWMIRLALAGTHSLAEEVRTIEEGPTQIEEHEQLMGKMYLLTNTFLQGNFSQRSAASSEEGELLIPESQDDEFEEGEIRESFRVEEYDGIYWELGLLLSCEMRDRDASAKAQKMRHLYVVRDDHLFIKRQVGNPKRIVCGRNRQIDVIAALHDGIAGGHKKEASRLGEGSVEPACYVPLEEPLDPEMETDMRDREEPQDPEMVAERPDPVRPQGREVITVGDDTPPCSPAPEPAQRSWLEGIPDPGSEKIPEFPPEATTIPEQEAEAEDQGVGERARIEAPLDLPLATQVTKSPDIEEPISAELPPVVSRASEGMETEASTPGDQGPRVEGTPRETREEKSARVRVRLDEIYARQAEMEVAGIEPTPSVEPKTSEQRIHELRARYESQRDAARQRSREAGRADEETSELREMGDLGFSATRQAIESMDRRVCETTVTSFQWYNLLSNELRVKELEVEHLTTQLAEERARSQAREVEWERRFGEMAVVVDRLSAAWEASQVGRAGADGQGRGMCASPSQGAAVEVPRQSEPMEEVPLDAVEEEGGAQESLMAMSTERIGSRLHELVAATGIGTPQERPQRLDTPEDAPRLGKLRTELGFWSTEKDSGKPDSQRQQQQEVMSEPTVMGDPQPSGVCRDEAVMTERAHEEGPRELGTPGCRPVSTAIREGGGAQAMEHGPQGHVGLPSCHEVTTETMGMPSASSSQGRKKKTARWHDACCFWCKEEGHRAVDYPELLENKAEGRVAEFDGKFYDRQGRIVERAPDGGRAQLYRQNQEELCK